MAKAAKKKAAKKTTKKAKVAKKTAKKSSVKKASTKKAAVKKVAKSTKTAVAKAGAVAPVKKKAGKKVNFKKDDFVVYPMHGVGQITEIATKTVLNKRKKYFIIELLNTKMKGMLPVENAGEIGLRHIIGKNDVRKVMKLLKEDYEEQEEEWKIRYQNNLAKIKSGSILQVAEVCRNLYKRARDKELSIMERKLYESAYSLIINEVALAKSIDVEDASNLISDVLSK